MSAHAQFTVETGIPVFFADSQSPWQRGTNTNTNGLLRQYFPKGTDLSRWSADEIEAVVDADGHRGSPLHSPTIIRHSAGRRHRWRPGPSRSLVPDRRQGQP